MSSDRRVFSNRDAIASGPEHQLHLFQLNSRRPKSRLRCDYEQDCHVQMANSDSRLPGSPSKSMEPLAIFTAVGCVGIMLAARHRRLILNRPKIINIPNASARIGSVRYASLEAGEKKSGHISTGPDEGILFFNSKFLFLKDYSISNIRSRRISTEATMAL